MALGPLAKATIFDTESGRGIPVMYNPEEIRLEQGNVFAEVGIPGLDSPPVQYVRGRARTLVMDLFFDTFEAGADVRAFSNQVVALLQTHPRTKAPPVLVFSMGQFQFRCVLVEAGARYTMFLRDGTPARAVLSVRFQEFVRVEFQVRRGLFLGPPTLHTIGERQTLPGLAAEYLGDPARWREIASANRIEDPFRLRPGAQIVVPTGRKA
jgi:hypothetical protein